MRSIKDIFRSYAVFDAEGRHTNGTDKESNHHYGDAYESLFYNRNCDWTTDGKSRYCPECESDTCHTNTCSKCGITRPTVRLMMEVGIADGSSLLAWSEVFPNAICVGMDIHHSNNAHGERIEFHLGDQRSNDDCRRAAAGRAFDVIVEDATHVLENSLLTLFYLWPFVRPGGLYIIEEFANIGALQYNVRSLWPNAEIIETTGPSGGNEPLVVLRKPL